MGPSPLPSQPQPRRILILKALFASPVPPAASFHKYLSVSPSCPLKHGRPGRESGLTPRPPPNKPGPVLLPEPGQARQECLEEHWPGLGAPKAAVQPG